MDKHDADLETREGQHYQTTHREMGDGFVRRIGNEYRFWDEEGNDKGLGNVADLSGFVPVLDPPFQFQA